MMAMVAGSPGEGASRTVRSEAQTASRTTAAAPGRSGERERNLLVKTKTRLRYTPFFFRSNLKYKETRSYERGGGGGGQ